MSFRKLTRPSRVDLRSFLLTHTHEEAAEHWGCCRDTIRAWKKEMKLNNLECKHPDCPNDFNEEQVDLLTGTMLGDAMIILCRQARHPYVRFKQAIYRREYIEAISKVLGKFSGSTHVEETMVPQRDSRTGKVGRDRTGRRCQVAVLRSISHPILDSWKAKWYPKGKKMVPADLRLNWRAAAYWYCDDGHSKKGKRELSLHTNSFSESEVRLLIERLRDDLRVSATMRRCKTGPIIYIGNPGYHEFLAGICPHVPWECMRAKMREVPPAREGWRPNKLSSEKAKDIRAAYFNTEATQRSLAMAYGVSQSMIAKIVANKAYPEAEVGHLGGSASVVFGFRYEGG